MPLPLRVALLLLGLAARCRSDAAPPTIDVNLDDDPRVRWAPLFQVFDTDFLKRTTREMIDASIPKWIHEALISVMKVSVPFILPEPYGEELRCMSPHFGTNLSDIVMLNFAYEANAYCTSIVAQDKHGNVYHGRNLDYRYPTMRKLTVNVNFWKNGKIAYTGTTFAGYVGLWTGQSPYKFTFSGDQRGKHHWWDLWKTIVSAFLMNRSPVSWLARETLEEAEDFQDAVLRLSKIPIMAEVYYIVGGARAGEGAVITRNRAGPADIWPLEALSGGWFRIETNFDHWLPNPGKDERREAAEKAMNATGQEHVNMDSLFQVLSLFPVCNRKTVYTTTMSAASPENYTSLVRSPACRVTRRPEVLPAVGKVERVSQFFTP
ncbi:N-acylethanolamine-hydrolyzing acid amidase-like [Hippocampus zosterae]|uniref:N-acylethanolamine-hydrolyzing acid amidase-like n=1 Tax=Hippocampus zosterae TaxID=109293 RepID=UPI00223C8F6E|nr:N-acylethanolamine-hydrolyzing acid amidase-like [Hippocampus zosterae]